MKLAEQNLHKKLQEMCDCFMGTDFLLQLKKLANSKYDDKEEEALKYLALAILHAISEKARKIVFKKKPGKHTVTIKHEEKNALPVPEIEIYDTVLEIAREIIHLEGEKGELPLAIGLGNDSLELLVKMESKGGKEKLQIILPKI